ncbi:MAG: alpha/beta hydrolase [Chloroflexota bacterium]|nr:alpha/beta hydrolase [Chloroflexota bacterium]
MPYATVGKDEIYYAERGAALTAAPRSAPIVFVHGAAGNHLVWGEQLRALGAITRAVALDLPGHGKSQPPGRDSMDGYRDVVLGLLDALRFDRAVIVGQSMGGGIAQTLALSHPDRVAGLVLVGTGARLHVLPAILDGILNDFENTARFVVDYSYAQPMSPSLRTLAEEQFRACPPAVTHGDYTACNAYDLLPRVAEIRAPTLVIVGSADRMTPVKYSEYLAAKIPNARRVLVEGAGHSAMIEKPTEVNRALIDFMTEVIFR